MFAPKVAKPQTKAAESSTSKLAPHCSALAGHRLSHDLVEDVLSLQHTIRDQATLRPLQQQASKPAVSVPGTHYEQEVTMETMKFHEAPSSASWNFSKIPLSPPERARRAQPLSVRCVQPGVIQPKLAIGPVDDPLEREADAVADRMMHMPYPALSISTAPEQISRKCATCEKEDEEEKKLQTKPGRTAQPIGEAPPIVHDVLSSSGQPLDAETRAFYEPRFGCDLSHVRLHTDAAAAASAQALHAHAYTVGSRIVLPSGRAPSSAGRQHLLAHELTHVVQQDFGYGQISPMLRRQTAAEATMPDHLDLAVGEDSSEKNPRLASFAAAARQTLSASPKAIISIGAFWSSQSAFAPGAAQTTEQLRDAARRRAESVRSALARLGVPLASLSVVTPDLNEISAPQSREGQVTLVILRAPLVPPPPFAPPPVSPPGHPPGHPPVSPPPPMLPSPPQATKPGDDAVDLANLTTFQVQTPSFTLVVKVPKSIELKTRLIEGKINIPKGASLTFKPVRGLPGVEISLAGEITKLSDLFSTPPPTPAMPGAAAPAPPGAPVKFSLSAAVNFKGFKIEASSEANLSTRALTSGLYVTLIEEGHKYQIPSSVLNDLRKAGAQLQKAVNALMGVANPPAATKPVGAPLPPEPAASTDPLSNLADVIDAISTIVDAMDKIDKAKKERAQPKLKIGPQVIEPIGPSTGPANAPSFGFGVTGTF